MADYTLDIPGDKHLTMQIGDTLRIDFKSPAKFCIESGNANAFNPPLPVNTPEPAGLWPAPPAPPATAIANTTITYCHVSNDKQCGPCKSPTGGLPGTIKVGSGTK